MSFPALPQFGGSSEPVPEWLRQEALYHKTNRKVRDPFWLLFFLALAGVLGYAIWMIVTLATMPPPPPPLAEAIIGKWEASDATGYRLEFTSNYKLTILRHEEVVIQGYYALLGNGVVELRDAKDISGRDIAGRAQFDVKCADDILVINPADGTQVATERAAHYLLTRLFSGGAPVRFARQD